MVKTQQYKRAKKHAKKKMPQRENRIFRSVNNYGIQPEPFPKRMTTRLHYLFNEQLSTDGTFPTYGTEQAFRLNSIYDPWYGVAGANNTTCVGHAVMAGIYKQYIVNGVRVRVTFSDPSIDGVAGTVSFQQNAVLQGVSFRTASEYDLTSSTIMSNSGSQRKTMEFYYKPYQIMGLSKLEYKANTTKYASVMTTNPATALTMRVAACNSSPGNGALNYMDVTVRIDYDVTFFDRKTLIPT